MPSKDISRNEYFRVEFHKLYISIFFYNYSYFRSTVHVLKNLRSYESARADNRLLREITLDTKENWTKTTKVFSNTGLTVRVGGRRELIRIKIIWGHKTVGEWTYKSSAHTKVRAKL